MRGLLVVVGTVMVVTGCGSAPEQKPPPPVTAGAALMDRDGKDIGRATLIETDGGVRITFTGHRLPPGVKGLAVTAVARCEPPRFVSAGPPRAHTSKLPDLNVSAAGEAGVDTVVRDMTLGPGPGSLISGAGTALVVLASPDAVRTDPTGTGGARIACGAVVRD